MTILLVEQNFRFASKVADRFYVMDHGKMIDNFHGQGAARPHDHAQRSIGSLTT